MRTRLFFAAGMIVMASAAFAGPFMHGNLGVVRVPQGVAAEPPVIVEYTKTGTATGNTAALNGLRLTQDKTSATLLGDSRSFYPGGAAEPSYFYFVADRQGAGGEAAIARVNRETGDLSLQYFTSSLSPQSVTPGDEAGEFFIGSESSIQKITGATFDGASVLTPTVFNSNIGVSTLQFFEGALYASTAGRLNGGLYRFTDAGAATLIATSGVPRPDFVDFAFVPGTSGVDDFLYIADQAADGFSTGGVRKYQRNVGGTYDFLYRISAEDPADLAGTSRGLRHLTFDGSTLFATTNEDSAVFGNRLVRIVDGGSAASSGVVTLATSGADFRFRGVEVVPEPASMAILGLGLAGLVARRRKRA